MYQFMLQYPIFALMLGTGLRVGEATGLRWEDTDFENNTISVNHTLVYFNHTKGGCYFDVNSPKTRAGERTVSMIESVRELYIFKSIFIVIVPFFDIIDIYNKETRNPK